jgi:hypothetical protein
MRTHPTIRRRHLGCLVRPRHRELDPDLCHYHHRSQRPGRPASFAFSRHFHMPVSASTAWTEPVPIRTILLACDLNGFNELSPFHGCPARFEAAAQFARAGVHQSTSPTRIRLVCGFYVELFHSAPSPSPGRNKHPCRLRKAYRHSRLGHQHAIKPAVGGEIEAWRYPSFGATAISRVPPRVWMRVG